MTKWPAAGVVFQWAVVVSGFAIAWRWTSPRVTVTHDWLLHEYDYVIVGAGSAGSILAARLTEDPDVTVALLEAGPSRAEPTEHTYTELQKSHLDWAYKTQPQTHVCYSIGNQRVPGVSGTRDVNDVIPLRGSYQDYDRWAAMGNVGWSYQDVLPYFMKIKAQTDKKADEEQRSTAVTYMQPALSRDHLHVLSDAHVTKVLFQGKRAVGVQYVHNNRMKSLGCRKEVILSAGTIGSAQILLLSGVGPKEDLKKMGIPVVADLPVGKNLRDHIHVHAALVTLEKPAALVPERLEILGKLKEHLSTTGTYSHAGPSVTASSRTKYQADNHHKPYIQYVLLNKTVNGEGHGEDINLRPEVHDAVPGGFDSGDQLHLVLVLQQQASVGYIELKSTNPFDMPLINPNYLAEDIDVDVLLDGIRTSRKIMGSELFAKKVGAKLVERIHPNCANETYDSDEYWKCYIRSNILSLCHPTSTCRMGPDDNANSVVDQRLRVQGLQRLRVVDASVMPLTPSGNTDFPTMMIAERAADIIKWTISVVTLNATRAF